MRQLDCHQRIAFLAMLLSVAFWGDSSAEGGTHFGRKKQVVCPPNSSIIELPAPSSPSSTPVTPDSSTPPSETPNAAPTEPAASPPAPQTADALNDALTGQYDVASASNFTAPNLLGDQFSSGSGRIVYQPPASLASFENDGSRVTLLNTPGTLVGIGPGNLSAKFGVTSPATGVFQGGQNVGPLTIPQLTFVRSGPFGNTSFPIAENTTLTKLAQPLFQSAAGQPGSLIYQYGNVYSVEGGQFGILYQFVPDPVTLVFGVANPSDGGVVGRTKLSDDNNPLPRDRIIFNYDYFNNVPLTSNGWNVNRFSPGFEKTFFNQMTSIEFRFPFASTLNSTFDQAAASGNTEFGNIHATLKALVYSNPAISIATGLGISLPTADDVNVRLANGQNLVQIKNESVLLTPYVAALWTPNSRVFAQTWMQYTVDTNGNPVLLNTAGTGLTSVGQLTSQTLLQLDGQIGYWLIRRAGATGLQLSGVAPFIELHYNTTLTNADSVVSNGVLIGDLAGRVDELNLSAGLTMLFGNNLATNLGAVVPLRTGTDRFFDYQIGLHSSYYFGPTARDRRMSSRVSNF